MSSNAVLRKRADKLRPMLNELTMNFRRDRITDDELTFWSSLETVSGKPIDGKDLLAITNMWKSWRW
jgi:hypothetical protein